jgi:hypothetical protein
LSLRYKNSYVTFIWLIYSLCFFPQLRQLVIRR